MYSCRTCSRKTPRYSRTCPHCAGTETLVPEVKPLLIEIGKDYVSRESQSSQSYSSGFPGLDKLITNGFQRGSTYLFVASHGTGKTSLVLMTGANFATQGLQVLFVSGEMSLDGMMRMSEKYGISHSALDFTFECSINKVEDKIRTEGYDVVIIDSIQTLSQETGRRTTYEEQANISIKINKIAHEHRVIFLIITQVNRDQKAQGSTAVLHNVDVIFNLMKGNNEEVIISTPDKNRQSFDASDRVVLRKTPKGLVEKQEIETGHLLRHDKPYEVGLAAAPVFRNFDFTTDEFTAVFQTTKPFRLKIQGADSSQNSFLSGVIGKLYPDTITSISVRGNLLEVYDRGADVAVIIAILSRSFDVPLPVNVAYIGSVDAEGRLIMVNDIGKRCKRAMAQGYSKVFGPVAIGSMKANWIECETIQDVIHFLDPKFQYLPA